MNKKRRFSEGTRIKALVMACLLFLQTLYGFTGDGANGLFNLFADVSNKLVIDVNLTYNDAGYADYRMTDAQLQNVSFEVKAGTTYVTPTKIEHNGNKFTVTVDGYVAKTEYTITATNCDGEKCSYSSSTAALATTPEPSEDDTIFYASANDIVLTPNVVEATTANFTIVWWDGNDEANARPAMDEFFKECKLEYSIDEGINWETWDKSQQDKSLLYAETQINNEDGTWTFNYSGIAKELKTSEKVVAVQYRLSVPADAAIDKYIINTEKSKKGTYQFDYCADVTGIVQWNDSAIKEKNRPEVTLTAYKAGETDPISDFVVNDHITWSEKDTATTTSNEWKYTISDLPTYDENGNRITYSVKETLGTTGNIYKTEYDNKSLSTDTDSAYSGGYIINTLNNNAEPKFNITWIEPKGKESARPTVTYTLWRYATEKKVSNTSDDYDYSTAAMVTYIKDEKRQTISETHDWTETDTWKKEEKEFPIDFSGYNLPAYDEQGYAYVYFLKQTYESADDVTTDIPNYDEYYFTKIEGETEYKNTDAQGPVVYNEGTLRNVYQEPVKIYLTKTWKNVKDTADYTGKNVELILTRKTADGAVDTDYEKSVTLTGFSAQINSKTKSVMAETYDPSGNKYEYIITEKIGDTEILDDGTFTLNGNDYKCTVTEPVIGTDTDAKNQPINTYTYQVVNEQTMVYRLRVVKKWGLKYSEIPFEDLPKTIKTRIKQNGTDYATVVINKADLVSEKGTATIEQNGEENRTATVAMGDGKTWTLEDFIKVPVFDGNNHEYVYTMTEEAVQTPEGTHPQYTVTYNQQKETIDEKQQEVITQTITNNFYSDGVYNYAKYWIYKNWNDGGDASSRSKIEYHVVILNAEGKIVYDLSEADKKNAFVSAVKTGYDNSSMTEEEKTSKKQIVDESVVGTDGKPSEATFTFTISKADSWKKEIILPKEMAEYAGLAGEGYTYYIIEAGMYDAGDKLIPVADYAYTDDNNGKYVLHNDKKKYVEKIEKATDGTFTFTNTRQELMDVNVNLNWNDFKNAAGVRPNTVTVKLKRYTDANSTPVEINNVKDITIDISKINEDGKYVGKFADVDEYTEEGKEYYYVVELTYTYANGISKTKLVEYDVTSDSDYTKGAYDSEKQTLSNSQLDFTFDYELNDHVKTKNVTFYKIWRDVAKHTNRPDITFKLFKVTTVTDENKNTTTKEEYCKDAQSKCSMLDGSSYAQKYTFYEMPVYSVIRDAQGKATGVEIYTYRATEVINTSLAIYYSYIYKPTDSVMELASGETATSFSYAGITDWKTYAERAYASDYVSKGGNAYAEENGCFVNGIKENLEYKGSKSWLKMPKGTTTDEYPYVEVYFFQNKEDSDIEDWAKLGRDSLRKNAKAYTTLNDKRAKLLGDAKGKDTITVPKYDERGAAYTYTIKEYIYRGIVTSTDGTNAQILPEFIMTSQSNGNGTNISLTNTFDLSNNGNKRSIIIEKEWTGITASENKTEAKFDIYRIEDTTGKLDIATVSDFTKTIGDKEPISTVYLSAKKAESAGDTTWSATTTIPDLPIYSPRGFEYVYVAVEDTSYAPSYSPASVDQKEPGDDNKQAVVLSSSENTEEEYRYVKFGSVAERSIDAIDTKTFVAKGSTASFKNEKVTTKAIITGSVSWEDSGNKFETRPVHVYISISKSADAQSTTEYTSKNPTQKPVEVFDYSQGSWGTGDSSNVYTIPAGAAGNTLKEDIIITWTKDDKNNKWNYTIAGTGGSELFDIYCDNGKQWKYSVVEVKTDTSFIDTNYQNFIDNYTGYGVTKTSTLTLATDETKKNTYAMADIPNTLANKITIQKQWSDSRDQYVIRPMQVAIRFQYRLKAAGDTQNTWTNLEINENNKDVDSFILNATGGWYKTFTQLPKKNAKGTEYEFRVVEQSITIKEDEKNTVTVPVKYYTGSNPSYELNKDELSKYENELILSTKTANDYYLGKAGSYTAKVPTEISSYTTGKVFIYNAFETEDVVNLPITKIWSGDEAYKDIVRPDTVYVKIQRALVNETATNDALHATDIEWKDVLQTDGSSKLILTLSSTDSGTTKTEKAATDSTPAQTKWTKTYLELPKTDAVTGKTCYYRAIETDASGNPISTISSYEVANTYTLNTETDAYETTITNTYKGGNLTVEKKWDDENNQDGKRPASVNVQLYYYDEDSKAETKWTTLGSPQTLSYNSDNSKNWKCEFTNLPVYYKSNKITGDTSSTNKKLMKYKVVETSVPTSYTATYSADNSTYVSSPNEVNFGETAVGTVPTAIALYVKNSYTPTKGNLTVKKAWYNEGDGIVKTNNVGVARPANLSVCVYRTYGETNALKYEYFDSTDGTNGKWKAIETGKTEADYAFNLNEGNSWKKEFTNLPLKTNKTGTASAAGTSYEYTYYLKELSTLTGYTNPNTSTGDNPQTIVFSKLANNTNNALTLNNYMKGVQFETTLAWVNELSDFTTRPNTYNFVLQKFNGTTWDTVENLTYDTTNKKYVSTLKPAYTSGNAEIKYRVVLSYKEGTTDKETVVQEMASTVTDNTDPHGAYLITHTSETLSTTTNASTTATVTTYKTAVTATLPRITISGDVKWEDKDNVYALRPDLTAFGNMEVKIDGYPASAEKDTRSVACTQKTGDANKNLYNYSITAPKYKTDGTAVGASTATETVPTYYTASNEQTTNTTNPQITDTKTISTATDTAGNQTLYTIINSLSYTSLKIVKLVESGDATRTFKFTVDFADRAGNYTEGNTTRNLTYDSVKVGATNAITITDLPVGIKYRITEDTSGTFTYTVSASGNPAATKTSFNVDKTNKKAEFIGVLKEDAQTTTSNVTTVTFTNTGTEKASISVNKKWAGEEANKYTDISTRPSEIHFILKRTTATSIGDTTEWETITEADPDKEGATRTKVFTLSGNVKEATWTMDISGYNKYDQNNKLYTYRAFETDASGMELQRLGNYEISYAYDGNTTSITNTYNAGKSLTVKKIWNDDNNREAKRPDTITVFVEYLNQSQKLEDVWEPIWDEPIVINKSDMTVNGNTWTYTFTDLPAYYGNDTKNVMKYRVEEVEVAWTKYTPTYSANFARGVELTTADQTIEIANSYIPERGNLTLSKKWIGDADAIKDSIADSIEVHLYRTYEVDGKTYYEYCSNEIENLWTVKDEEDADCTDEYKFKLEKSKDWKLELTNIPLYTNNGGKRQYTYYLKEESTHSAYQEAEPVYTLLEKDKTSILELNNVLDGVNVKADFTWDDVENKFNSRVDYDLVLQRRPAGETEWDTIKTKDVDTDSNETETYDFGTQPKYNGSNVKYEYQIVLVTPTGNVIVSKDITEKPAGAYQIDSTGFSTEKPYECSVIANLPLTTLSVTKKWADEQKQYATISARPVVNYIVQRTTDTQITDETTWETLKDNETDNIKVFTFEPADTDCWEVTMEGLVQYSPMNDTYFYRAVETDKDGNTVSKSGNYKVSQKDTYETKETTISNTYISGNSVIITETFEDDNNRDETRPDKIEVSLEYKDSTDDTWHPVDDKYVLNEENNWSYTVDDLPVYDTNNEKIEYRVEQTVDTYEPTPNKESFTLEEVSNNTNDSSSDVEIKVTNTHIPTKQILAIDNATVNKEDATKTNAGGTIAVVETKAFDTFDITKFVAEEKDITRYTENAIAVYWKADTGYQATDVIEITYVKQGELKEQTMTISVDDLLKQKLPTTVTEVFPNISLTVNEDKYLLVLTDKNHMENFPGRILVTIQFEEKEPAKETVAPSTPVVEETPVVEKTPVTPVPEDEEPEVNKLAIRNDTPNPTNDKKDIGGTIMVLGQTDLDKVDISKLNAKESDVTSYVKNKTGVYWAPDEYWSTGETITITYKEEATGKKHKLTISYDDLKNGNIPEEVKKIFPNLIFITSDDETGNILFLADNTDGMPAETMIVVDFVPSFAIMNLTEGNKGGEVKSVNGTFNKSSDGIYALDGNPGYRSTAVEAKAKNGYCVDMDNLVITYYGNYDKAETKSSKLTVKGDKVYGTIKVEINGKMEKIEITGTVQCEYDEDGNVIGVTIETDAPVPAVYGVYFMTLSGSVHDKQNTEDKKDEQTDETGSEDEKTSETPKTGDEAPILPLTAVLFMSAGAAATLAIRRKKNKKNA